MTARTVRCWLRLPTWPSGTVAWSGWVGEHRVLTTDLLCALGFGSIVTARHRLSALTRISVLRRFRPHPETGSAPWHYLLGPVGGAGSQPPDERVAGHG
jgi:hypothetical protein